MAAEREVDRGGLRHDLWAPDLPSSAGAAGPNARATMSSPTPDQED